MSWYRKTTVVPLSSGVLLLFQCNLFLVQDGVFVGLKEQAPKQYPNHFELLENFVNEGGKLRICGVCTNARGISNDDLIDGAEVVGMHDFVEWVAESDKVLMF